MKVFYLLICHWCWHVTTTTVVMLRFIGWLRPIYSTLPRTLWSSILFLPVTSLPMSADYITQPTTSRLTGVIHWSLWWETLSKTSGLIKYCYRWKWRWLFLMLHNLRKKCLNCNGIFATCAAHDVALDNNCVAIVAFLWDALWIAAIETITLKQPRDKVWLPEIKRLNSQNQRSLFCFCLCTGEKESAIVCCSSICTYKYWFNLLVMSNIVAID